jgi:acyl-CoA-binding protein
MSDMKLIMENWRNFQLNEISGNDPVTYGLLKSILKLMTGIKQGLTGDALANASGIFNFVAGGDAADLV